MQEIFYRKRVADYIAKPELEVIGKVDRLDPKEQWHIGFPEVETKVDKLWTLKFKHGGKSLGSLTKENPEIILKVFQGLAGVIEGLDIMNRNGIYHRDIKVNNILYNEQGVVRIIDFGIAIIGLPSSPMDEIFAHIYPVWPFETQLVSGNSGVYTTSIYGAYIDHSYFKIIQSMHRLDPSECRDNAVNLKRRFPDGIKLHQEIIKHIDVYSLGVTLSHLLSDSNIIQALSIKQYHSIRDLARKMVEPYTSERISLSNALEEYRKICWSAPT